MDFYYWESRLTSLLEICAYHYYALIALYNTVTVNAVLLLFKINL